MADIKQQDPVKRGKFVHLHLHTEYSLLDGLSKLPDLMQTSRKQGQHAVAITDHGVMYGALHFYNHAKKAGIKPIIGVEVYMAKNSRFDKQNRMGTDQFHLILLAKNYHGYQNINKLVTLANFEGFSYKPRIDKELLFKYKKDIIVTSACMSSIFNRLLLEDKDEEAEQLFLEFKKEFGDDFYIEIQDHVGIKNLKELTKKQVAIARKLDIKLVATNDVHYIHQEDWEAQDALLCVQTRKLISDKKRMSMGESPDYYLKSSEEMIEAFSDYPDAIVNTLEVADKCNITIPTGQLIFPEFEIPKGETLTSFLEKMAYKGAKEKLGKITPEIKKRIDYELKIINDKGYAAYFLITQDFVNWSKKNGVTVGPGRGSAAGSLVSYCIGITTIDPLYHGLAFERFLNPQRPTPPDIDLDFADTKRDKVIQYCSDKYGADHVGHVITFGKMEARVAIRDIGRVLGYPYEEPDKIAKLIPNIPGKKTPLKQAIQEVPELAEYYKQPRFKKLLDLAMKVEGSIRHSSVHAAAVIITDKPLPEYVAIQKDSKSGKTITQFDMYALDCNVDDDAIGLLKFDFLGLRNLSTINTAVELIQENKNIKINIDKIPLDDKATFNLLAKGDTFGVFQLESAGMRRVARTLKPNLFSDITAMVALYRPGPMDLIPTFIEGKHNPKAIKYPDETLKPILEETYGVMVYQEQILLMANIMAGYTLGEADILRRAIGKKKKKLLDQNKKRFIDQSVQKGYTLEVAKKVWSFIEAFANYGFNKAHAASYAMISYQTAYLKANYPVEYMTALMSIESGSHSMNRDVKIAVAIETSKKMGIKIYSPDINRSHDDFIIEQDPDSLQGLAIRFGFNAIKHIGSKAIENILEVRKGVGKFTSLTQFINKTDSRKVNKTTLETLIKVGVMDRFGNRASMLEGLEKIRQTASQLQSDVDGQDSLFTGVSSSDGTLKDTFPQIEEYPQQELLSFEKELLGLYLTDHPLAQQLKIVAKTANKKIEDLDVNIHKDKVFLFGGILTNVRQITTKKTGKPMAFAQLQDETGSIDIVIFPRTFAEYDNFIRNDVVLLVKGKVDERDGELQLLVEKISIPSQEEVTHKESSIHKEIFIPRKTSKDTLNKLGDLLKANKGSQSVVVLIPNGAKPQKMLLPYTVKWNKELEVKIAKILE